MTKEKLDWDFCSLAMNAENCTSGEDRPELNYTSEVLKCAVG